LPMKKGRAGTMTHDYKRNGTTTLFAALDILKGQVIGQCMARHRHQEFLKPIEKATPRHLDIHGIADNYATHKHPSINLARSAEGIVAFYNQRGTAEQHIKEGKGAIKWTRLPCRTFAANVVRLQLHALVYNLGNFLRTIAMPKTAQPWSLTSLREKLIKIGPNVVSHGRYVIFQFQMAEVAVPRQMFAQICL
jgi:hypothetical protein